METTKSKLLSNFKSFQKWLGEEKRLKGQNFKFFSVTAEIASQ